MKRPAKVSAYVAAARSYARDVVAGRIPACRFVRLACERHLDGLRRQRRRDYPYRLDSAAATKVCKFVELLPHTKGQWAARNERLRLEPWQAFVYVNVFGWLRKRDDLRRYRRVYLEVPRKNTKSTISAAGGLYMLAADGEHGAEVYSGATTEKQAWEVFRPARLMALQTPEFVEAFGVQVGAKNLHIPTNASRFEPLIGKPGDGASPSCAIIDEYHEHATDEQHNTMRTGMGARQQPLLWVITTAGSDTSGPCYALRQEVVQVLEGKVENDELFGAIWTLDEEDDWTSEAALRKANPNYDVSVSGEFLRQQQKDAVNDPRKQADFKTKHLNIWVTAASPYFNAEKWARLANPELHPAQFKGEPCFAGLDLASKLDLTAAVRAFRREVDGAAHYYVFGRFYAPAERTKGAELRHYAEWAVRGHLTATPGNVTDYGVVEADLLADHEASPVTSVGFDPYNATYLATRLMDAGLPVVEVPQTVAHLSEPMKEVQALIEDGRIHHDGNPCLAWMIGNVTAQLDRNENVFPRKERPENKIDGAVALIVAMSRAMATPEAPAGSIYDDPGSSGLKLL